MEQFVGTPSSPPPLDETVEDIYSFLCQEIIKADCAQREFIIFFTISHYQIAAACRRFLLQISCCKPHNNK